jgi:cytochrome c2
MLNKYLLYVASVLFAVMISINVYAGDKDTSQETLFQKKCTTCHSAKLAMKKNATKDNIQKTIKRMQLKRGSDISDADTEILAQYIFNSSTVDQK